MERPVTGGQSRRNGAGGRSSGAGLVPQGALGTWVKLERPANDNKAPWPRRIRRGLRLAYPWAVAALLVYYCLSVL